MTHLEAALQEALNEVNTTLAELAPAAEAARNARSWAEQSTQQLEGAAADLGRQAEGARARLELGHEKVAASLDAASEEQSRAGQEASELQRTLEREKLLTLEQLEGWRHELEALEALVSEHRRQTESALDAASRKTLESLTELANELDRLSAWTSGELTPRVRLEQKAVEERAEALRVQVVEQTLPQVTARYEEVHDHLLRLASDLERSLATTSGQAFATAQSALGDLGKTMSQLCEQTVAEVRQVSQVLDKETGHIRSRCEELMRQAKTYLQFGTGTASHLGLVVGLVTYTESILVEAKILEPPAEVK